MSGIISLCDKYNFEKDELIPDERIYFNDLGILRYYLSSGGYSDADSIGILAENFVFKTLNEKSHYHSFRNDGVAFGITSSGELDFVVVSEADGNRYGIEVKSGKNSANTGMKLLNTNKLNYLIVFKGITQKNCTERCITMPIWLAPLFDYNIDKVEPKNELKDLNLF